MKNNALALLLVACGLTAAAQATDKPKFSIAPTGRILVVGAGYMGGNSGVEEAGDTKFVSGVAVPDLRIGVKASYGKWKAKVDVGFGYGKVGLKDTYLEYDFNDMHLLRGGYFVPQFGLNSETSSSMKPSYEEATSNEFFYANPRLLALMYQYSGERYFAATTVFAEAAAMTNNATAMGKQAWGAQTRLVWRPLHTDDGTMAQVGFSINYSTPTADDHTGFTFSSNFPSRVSKVGLLRAEIDNARGLVKFTPELLLAKNRFAFETQYYYMNVARKNGCNNYRAQGVYAMLRTLLIGSNYGYTMADAGVATPDPHTFEMVLMYNYTNASDASAGIYGGITNDASCTFNYYINKYMITRLRYSYTTVRDRRIENMLDKRHVNIVEARLQIKF